MTYEEPPQEPNYQDQPEGEVPMHDVPAEVVEPGEPEAPQSHYDNRELQERAGEDRGLLDRLVALAIAKEMHEQDPNNRLNKVHYELMQHIVEDYEQGKR